ncbi:hypothetical protein Salat_1654600 [Sesamum alatum]|uniref:Uncharacterized protein n=1 Tax=Sesamum alatum TaxID=300844 RepID=A0AAE2CJM6_9LAMI|nr:hypothetical protein Salat_1654600 [Sesamum alatum]
MLSTPLRIDESTANLIKPLVPKVCVEVNLFVPMEKEIRLVSRTRDDSEKTTMDNLVVIGLTTNLANVNTQMASTSASQESVVSADDIDLADIILPHDGEEMDDICVPIDNEKAT